MKVEQKSKLFKNAMTIDKFKKQNDSLQSTINQAIYHLIEMIVNKWKKQENA